ncbi:unnamed protein product [Paramecium octaurelia]|uniref:Uncharacterized protein n=1 Tax=Paramecium octaurelia TaxID=43137 RepID=A0A8S1Y8I2_PAROT|nr:unnamed protein product [Paramecium octaurelia]
MQKLIDELNLTQYKSVEQVVRIYTFFKTKELNVQIQFTFDDFYQCLLNNEKPFLIEYLVCLYLEVHLNDIHHPYIQLLINQNRCVRQCLIFNEMANILRFLIDHHKIAEPVDIPDEHFHDLDFDTKIEILIFIVNILAFQSKWFNGVIQNKIQLFQKGIVKEKKQESKKQWQEELHELYGQQDEIIIEERKILSRKQLAISNKKRIKEIEKEKEQIDERIIKLNNLIDIDIKELQKFGVNSMKILLRDHEYCVWIIQAMPNYVLIKINKKFNLLYGDEIHKLIDKIDDGPLKECLELESEEICNEKRVISISKDIQFQLDQTGLHQFKKQEGKPEYLIFCKDVNNLDEILVNMILEIEEKITLFFRQYLQLNWTYPKSRNAWREEIKEGNIQDFIYTFLSKINQFRSRFYEFDNDDEVPDDYKDKKIPLFYYYKHLGQDLQEVQNCDYAYVLILYCRVLVQQSRNIERQKEKLVELAEQAEYQEQNYIKSQQKSIQPVKPKRAQRAIIDDDDDDEDFNLNSYYYR